MVKNLDRFLKRLSKGLLAGVLTLVLVGMGGLMMPHSALAATAGASLSETMDLKISKAAQQFAAAILEEYQDALEDSFSSTLKPLKSVTKDLTKQLSKVAVSPTGDTATLAPKIAASQAALEAATQSFDTLVADSDAFKKALAAAPDQLKAALETQLGTKFADLQTAFDGVSKALATLTKDTSAIEGSDVTAAVGRLTEDSTTLAQAIELAKTVISSFGD
ncbi:MAG TPA: hypothetical protein IGR64_02570 [Leptolyngbyaceae cyanobacterium M65_K2018_010]|nr:hypothetical protein [Leptolyngbyaceae cyanobacterium M65_K2018_010]